MRLTKRMWLPLLAALAAACATPGGRGGGGGGPSDRYHQADYKLPTESQLDSDAERGKFRDAKLRYERGRVAQESGNLDQARAEYLSAADNFVAFVQQFPSSEWRMPLLATATQLYLEALQFEKAAETAMRVVSDPNAKPISKVIGARLAAAASLQAANQKVKANQLEPIRLANADQRKEPLNPRVPPGEWKRYVDAADLYLANLSADPEQKKPAAERRGFGPAQAALVAAQVTYAFDNMEAAQKRFADILERFPDEPEVMADAVALYLQTFLHLKDQEGYQAAVDRVRKQTEALSQKATTPAQKEAYAKVLESLSRAQASQAFDVAQKLLEAGKPAEAAQAFEDLAKDPRGGDVANALHNAAVAWDKAQKPDRAAELRKQIVAEHGDSKLAANNLLLLAVYRSKQGDHETASKMYDEFLQKWPDSPNRCVALQNVASELDLAKKTVDAAGRYVTFATDDTCGKSDPNVSARALYRAGRLFQDAKQRAKAKEAYAAAAAVTNVTDAVAKSQVDDAKRRMRRL
jgi:TolA-binding protein